MIDTCHIQTATELRYESSNPILAVMVTVTSDVGGSFPWAWVLAEDSVAQNPPGDLQCSFGMKKVNLITIFIF